MTKDGNGVWAVTPSGRQALDQYPDPESFRLAAHHAIDKAALSRALFAGKAVPLSVITTPGTPSYDPSFKFSYDPKLARELLAKSGWSTKKPISIGMATTNLFNKGTRRCRVWRVGALGKKTASANDNLCAVRMLRRNIGHGISAHSSSPHLLHTSRWASFSGGQNSRMQSLAMG